MYRNKIVIEVKAGERLYSLECYPESPLGELFDVLSTMKALVIKRMEESEQKPLSEVAEESVIPEVE